MGKVQCTVVIHQSRFAARWTAAQRSVVWGRSSLHLPARSQLVINSSLIYGAWKA